MSFKRPFVVLSLLIGESLFAAPAIAQVPTTRRPNVLFILTDDQGYADLNCYGSKDLQTPAIDSLAAGGTKFTQFYASAPICSPSRASIMTGKVPQKAGLETLAGSQHGARGMPTEQVTIAEVFKAGGYDTAHFGKWHMGFVPEEMPNAQGFDYSFGFMGGCIDNYSHYYMWGGPNKHDLWRNGVEIFEPGKYLADLITDEFSRYVGTHVQKPWLAYWAINMPHYPVQPAEKWRAYYADKMSYPRNDYAAAISTVDDQVAAMLKKLDDSGQRQNTIVVFMSDQGQSYEQAAGLGGGSSGIYRGGKFSLFEGGIRVPAIINWPGHLPAGETRTQLVAGVDWLPTLAELCDVPLPKDVAESMDGKSFNDIIKNVEAPTHHSQFHWWSGGTQWAVRDGDWKLLHDAFDPRTAKPIPGLETFLVNLGEDPGEKANVAKDHPEIVERLTGLHDAWVATLPEKKKLRN
ncbi:MAG: sulfatase [Phycisphaerales bacterium]|nr:sulfatase [Phycisphaerales bacterium]